MANKYNMYLSFKLQDIETVSQLCTFAICSVYCSGYLTTYKDLHRKSFWQQSDLDMTSSDRNRLQNQIKTLNETFFLSVVAWPNSKSKVTSHKKLNFLHERTHTLNSIMGLWDSKL